MKSTLLFVKFYAYAVFVKGIADSFAVKIKGFDDFAFFVYGGAVAAWLSAVVHFGVNNGGTGFFLFRNIAEGADNVVVIIAVPGGNIVKIVSEVKLCSAENIKQRNAAFVVRAQYGSSGGAIQVIVISVGFACLVEIFIKGYNLIF